MFDFSCKTLLQIITRNLRIHNYALRMPYAKSFSQISESTNSPALTVDYLINSCGLSPETALSSAKQIRADFRTTENPDSVLKFLESNGFSKTHIAKLVSVHPRILCASVDNTLKPKIKQFQDVGFSGLELAELFVSNPSILTRGLKRFIIPNLEFIRGFVGTGENVIRALKRAKWLFGVAPELRIRPNVALLRHHKVPDSRIAYLITNQPGSLLLKAQTFERLVETTEGFGFKIESRAFIVALHVMCSMSESTMEAKIKLFKDLGWSKEQVFSAFRRRPLFLCTSEKKITQGMDFFTKMLNWNASVISAHPLLLIYSLKERIIPRFKVYQILRSKELFKKESMLITMFCLSEKAFLQKYLLRYQDEYPHLLKAYKGERVNDLAGCLVKTDVTN